MQIENSALPATHVASKHAVASPQLVQAANAFEASFMKELLKPMREDPLFGDGSGLGGDSLGSDGPGGSMGTVSSISSDAFAQSLAKNGGLGIAKRVLAELAPVEAKEAQHPATQLGLRCGGCAPPLTMGTATSEAAKSGSIEMLGQGNSMDKTSAGKGVQATAEKLQQHGMQGTSVHLRSGTPHVIQPIHK